MKKRNKHIFGMLLMFLIGLFVGTQYHRIWYMLPRVKKRVKYQIPKEIVCAPQQENVGNASAGEPYNIFIQEVGRVPRSRYEYKKWLKNNYTTDWEYWYDRFREYREWRDGYSVGSGPFTHPRHQ